MTRQTFMEKFGHSPKLPLGIGVVTARRHRLDGDKLSPPRDAGNGKYKGNALGKTATKSHQG